MSDQPQPEGLTEEEIKRVLNYEVVVKGNFLFSTRVYGASHLSASRKGIRKVQVSDEAKTEVWVYVTSREGMMYDIVPDWDCENPYPLN